MSLAARLWNLRSRIPKDETLGENEHERSECGESMISIILTLLIELVGAFALSRLSNRRMEECVPVIFSGTIVFLYIFYCLSLLRIGRIVLYCVIAAMVLLAVIRQIRHPKESLKIGEIFSPGIVFFLCLSAAFLIYASALKPAVWDELRLWAAMPKAIHFSEALQVGEGSLLYSTMQSYPPGMALLIAFFTALTSGYSYGSAFAVYWIFLAALLLPAMRKFVWKQWYVIAPAFLAAIAVPFILTINSGGASGDYAYFFSSMFIDPILGCVMGHAFFLAVQKPFRDLFSTVRFSLILFILPALKNLGLLYACAAFAAALILWLLDKPKTKYWLPLIPAVCTAASYVSWQLIIRSLGTGEFIDLKLTEFTAEKLGSVLKGIVTWGHIPILCFLVFFIALDLFVTLYYKDLSKRTALTAFLCMLAAFLIFFYGYVSHYGLMVSSIHRYFSVFTFASFVYLFLRIFSVIDPKWKLTLNSDVIEKEKQLEKREGKKPVGSIWETILPKRTMHAGRVIAASLVLVIVAVLLLFGSKSYQLKNESYADAQRTISGAAASIGQTASAKCYLALGGDIRKESQRHETYALEAIGTSVNIQNIWCDKLFNEAEDGVVTDQDEMTEIFAKRLQEEGYEYVIVAQPDDEIRYAISRIAPELPDVSDGTVLRVVPAASGYGISLETP